MTWFEGLEKPVTEERPVTAERGSLVGQELRSGPRHPDISLLLAEEKLGALVERIEKGTTLAEVAGTLETAKEALALVQEAREVRIPDPEAAVRHAELRQKIEKRVASVYGENAI